MTSLMSALNICTLPRYDNDSINSRVVNICTLAHKPNLQPSPRYDNDYINSKIVNRTQLDLTIQQLSNIYTNPLTECTFDIHKQNQRVYKDHDKIFRQNKTHHRISDAELKQLKMMQTSGLLIAITACLILQGSALVSTHNICYYPKVTANSCSHEY